MFPTTPPLSSGPAATETLTTEPIAEGISAGHTYQDLTSVHGALMTQLQERQRAQDIYGLLAMESPEIATHSTLFQMLKDSIRVALSAYTFLDPAASVRARDHIVAQYNLVKLIGVDYRTLPPGGPVREEEISPYRMKGVHLFKITAVAARAFCQVLQETPEVDALIIVSKPQWTKEEDPLEETINAWANDSFGDEVARIFAENLPQNRFKLLRLIGGFGQIGATAIVQNLPRLLMPYPLDPNDFNVDGMFLNDENRNTIYAQRTQYFLDREAADSGSVVHFGGRCSVM